MILRECLARIICKWTIEEKFLGKMMKEGRKKIEFLEKLEKATRINRNDYFVINIACESYVGSFL